MEALLVGSLGALGYYLKKDNKPVPKKINDELISENEKPSETNIYQNRHYEKVFSDEFKRSTEASIDSLSPYKTGRVNGVYLTGYPQTNWDQQGYVGADRKVIPEGQLNYPVSQTTTAFPNSTFNELEKTATLVDSETVEAIGTQEFNEKRNNIPNPEFENFANVGGKPVYRTVYSDGGNKGVTVYDKGHNNMEPFFGGSVKQNMRDDANKTLMENFTGANPLYRHKEETKRFFPLQKNPYAVGGTPVANNRETERYIPSIYKQNILPFEQVKVAPGLDKSMTDTTSNIGFHDDYRPIGKGMFRDINEMRVNPKLTYKGRISGEGFFVSKQAKTAPVISRKHVDLSYTNFKPQDTELVGDKKEGFSNYTQNNKITSTYKYRDVLVNGPDAYRQTDLNQDAVILKNTDRPEYENEIQNYPGIAGDSIRHTTSWFDDAKATIKEQTERNIHKYTNAYGEVNRGQNNPYDEAKTTIRQQTQDHKHKYMNAGNGNQRGTVYHYDIAKQTIKEQTEDNVHKYMNAGNGNQRGTVYHYDIAKQTIKEQTEDHQHSHINTNGTGTSFYQQDRTEYENATINALKESVLAGRAPTQQGTKVSNGKEVIRMDITKQQYNTYDNAKVLAVTAPVNVDKMWIGQATQQKGNYSNTRTRDVYNPINVQQFKNNPYTQKLDSYNVPYNPSYPPTSH